MGEVIDALSDGASHAAALSRRQRRTGHHANVRSYASQSVSKDTIERIASARTAYSASSPGLFRRSLRYRCIATQLASKARSRVGLSTKSRVSSQYIQ